MTFSLSTSILSLPLSTTAFAEEPPEISKKDFSYSFGVLIGQSMRAQGLEKKDLNHKIFMQALQETLDGKPSKWDEQQAQRYVMMKMQQIQADQAKLFAKEHQQFFDSNAKKEGVISLPSGVQYKIIKDWDGALVKPESTIQVHYTGSLVDGTVFDSSVERNQPATLGVNQVIPGWQEILPKMNVGSKWKIFIPPALGYGASGAGSIPPHSILIFEIEVLGIEK